MWPTVGHLASLFNSSCCSALRCGGAAYTLNDGVRGGYKSAVIDALVENIQAGGRADRAVLLLGYRADMERMLAECNPGLKSRFSPEDAFVFDDYRREELFEILRDKCRRDLRRECSFEALLHASDLLEKQRALPRFGNARAVDNLLSRAQIKADERVQRRGGAGAAALDRRLLAEDFDAQQAAASVDLDHVCDDLVGCDAVRQLIEDWRATMAACVRSGKDPRSRFCFNYRFVGPPGTGAL